MEARHDQPKIRNPIIHLKKDAKVKPIYYQDQEINTPSRFAILKTTDNGAYVRNGMLYYVLNNIEIYTEINNVIFVDLKNQTLTIKQNNKVTENVAPEDPETRQYVILMYLNDSDDNAQCIWDSMSGRSAAYEYIKQYIDIYRFNPDKSVVITDNVPFKDALSVTQFVKYLQNGNLVDDEDFNIDDYREDNSEFGLEEN